MNKKITFPLLAAALSEATASNEETAEAFLKVLFDTISSALARGESVSVKGLGTFAPGMNEDNPVLWQPDISLAEAVNEPFAFFEPEELGEDVDEEVLANPSFEIEDEVEATIETEAEKEESITAEDSALHNEKNSLPDASSSKSDIDDSEVTVTTTSLIQEEITIPESPSEGDISADNLTEHKIPLTEYTDKTIVHDRRIISPWLMLAIGLIVGAITGYFTAAYIYIHSDKSSEYDKMVINDPEEDFESESIVNDTIATDDITPVVQDKSERINMPLAVDTVTSTRYLTTMSRQYFGDYRFWVYIYEENANIISNPNKISPGTAVVIPRAEKYGIDVHNPASLQAAESKSAEILSRIAK